MSDSDCLSAAQPPTNANLSVVHWLVLLCELQLFSGLYLLTPNCIHRLSQENLRYEGEILTDKLIKLRATRHDLEAELFSLKDKRIRLLEVIQHLEDEEMQLVSEVSCGMTPG